MGHFLLCSGDVHALISFQEIPDDAEISFKRIDFKKLPLLTLLAPATFQR
jgi:hypothetical protein